ncbi:porin family protein [Nitrospirales bacterium NOB]|nr:porin family protein [Nitrospira sp. NTP2]MDL1888738.1 porin family protein [Nitrospirales bacterium NOB]
MGVVKVQKWLVAAIVSALLWGASATAHAENYVAFAIGPNLATLDTTDVGKLDLSNNLAYGAKFGHYFDDRGFNWFGLEVDMYRSSPDIKAQSLPRQDTNLRLSGPIPGSSFTVHSLAFNALVRVTGYQYKVEPYAGLGIGLNMGNVSDGNFRPEASFAPSFNVLAGIKYYVTPKIAPFIEYKYNFAHFSFSRTEVTADYRANLFMFGVAFHFGR